MAQAGDFAQGHQRAGLAGEVGHLHRVALAALHRACGGDLGVQSHGPRDSGGAGVGGGDQPPSAQNLESDDFRRSLPRFQGEAGAASQQMQQAFATLAQSLDQPVAAVALAGLLQRQPHVLPIPGTRRAHHLPKNLAARALVLPDAVMQKLDPLFAPSVAAGARFPDAG